MKTITQYISTIIVALMISQLLFSQEKISSDSLYKEAKMLYKDGKDIQAEKICLELIESNPNNFDVRVLLANNYMWDKRFTDAKPHLDYVLAQRNNYYDALSSSINWYLWTKEYALCVSQCDTAISYYPDKVEFKLKKALSLRKLHLLDDAQLIVKQVLENDSNNIEALKLDQLIFLDKSKNKLTVSYRYDNYENNMIPPTHLAYLEYSRKIDRGTIVGRINYGNRFNIDGVQVEADAYLKLIKRSYMYLNAGFSEARIFPDYRFGAEWYQSFGKGNEVSLGGRYLLFLPKKVFIYTASYGKYVGNWWINGRTFVTPKNDNTSVSGLLTIRRYCTKYNYIGLQFKTGVNPDDRANVIDPAKSYFLNSTGIRLEFNTLFKKRWIAALDLIYENEEWRTARYRNVFSLDMKFSYLF
jgi:YaiO family outer membrane protein